METVEAPVCPQCNTPAVYVNSIVVYKTKSYGKIWVCYNYPKCDSYVGTHPGSDKPLGFPAGPKLRQMRHECHLLFDKLWSNKELKALCGNNFKNRHKAYKWLRQRLNLSYEECHFGMFDDDMCNKAQYFLKEYIVGITTPGQRMKYWGYISFDTRKHLSLFKESVDVFGDKRVERGSEN